MNINRSKTQTLIGGIVNELWTILSSPWFCAVFCHLFVVIILSVLLQFTTSDYLFGIFKLFLVPHFRVILVEKNLQ